MGGWCYVVFNFVGAWFVLNYKLNCGGRILAWAIKLDNQYDFGMQKYLKNRFD